MSLRKIIMIVIYSLLFTSIVVFNTNILMFFHKIGIDFSNLCGINPNLSVTIMGGYDIAKIIQNYKNNII